MFAPNDAKISPSWSPKDITFLVSILKLDNVFKNGSGFGFLGGAVAGKRRFAPA